MKKKKINIKIEKNVIDKAPIQVTKTLRKPYWNSERKFTIGCVIAFFVWYIIMISILQYVKMIY